jgi:hypothetical protein
MTLQKRAILRRSSGRNMAVGPAQQHVGLDADLAQFLHRVLGRLGLQLAGGMDVGQQGQVDEAGVAAFLDAHLADGLQEGQGFDVAHRAAHLDERDVGALGAALDDAALISSVMWGMTCTVSPRYSPRAPS